MDPGSHGSRLSPLNVTRDSFKNVPVKSAQGVNKDPKGSKFCLKKESSWDPDFVGDLKCNKSGFPSGEWHQEMGPEVEHEACVADKVAPGGCT